jgi:hypothetical protein
MYKHEIVLHDNYLIKIKREFIDELLVTRIEYDEKGQIILFWKWDNEKKYFTEFEFVYHESGDLIKFNNDGVIEDFSSTNQDILGIQQNYKKHIIKIIKKYKQ